MQLSSQFSPSSLTTKGKFVEMHHGSHLEALSSDKEGFYAKNNVVKDLKCVCVVFNSKNDIPDDASPNQEKK